MSEYEIFNNEEENIEIIPEPKKSKKEKKVVVKEKTENRFVPFLKECIKLSVLPMVLAVLAIFFSLFVQFLPIISVTFAGAQAAAAFFFIGFACAFSALVIELINIIKEKKFEFSIKFVLICLAFFVLFI
jgi:hypothetical protein